MLDGNALQKVGRLDQRIKVGLLGHGNGKGGGGCKDELGHDDSGNETGRVLVKLVANGAI